jgi:hypothetical protein
MGEDGSIIEILNAGYYCLVEYYDGDPADDQL